MHKTTFGQSLAIAAIRGYQVAVSPALHFAGGARCGCRFTPSCSAYAIECVREHGAGPGSVLAARRILRCGPWSAGGEDPVPTRIQLG